MFDHINELIRMGTLTTTTALQEARSPAALIGATRTTWGHLHHVLSVNIKNLSEPFSIQGLKHFL